MWSFHNFFKFSPIYTKERWEIFLGWTRFTDWNSKEFLQIFPMCHLMSLGSRALFLLCNHKNFLIVFAQNRFNSNSKVMKQILSSSRKRLTKKCCCWFWELLPRRQRRGDIDIIFVTIIIVLFIIFQYFLVVWTYFKNTSLNIIHYCSCSILHW